MKALCLTFKTNCLKDHEINGLMSCHLKKRKHSISRDCGKERKISKIFK